MSAPPRGPHGGGTTNGRATPPPGFRGRGAPRGSPSNHSKGRGGRGRGAFSSPNPKAEELLQGLQAGSLNKTGSSGSTQSRRGHSATLRSPSRSTRGRGAIVGRGSASSVQSVDNVIRVNPSHKDFMSEMTTKFQDLKQRREGERAKAIRDGFLADPEKKTSLDKAITPVGTCTEMCPEFERVERIVQNMVEKPEKISNETTGRDMPAEERMVKRFRRSAAGYDEQLPSDIRTPATLQTTLDYLLNEVIGGEDLAAVHKFVWDRTRGIRNDFSIQQVSKDEDVRLAVDCFERIARFHVFALHQLSNPDNLTGDSFDAHQEREQLNNTLLSLMYYYDDNRDKQVFANEAEFRAYCIIFELQSSHPDLEDRMQSWPPQLLNDKRVQTAFRLYSAATNTLFEQGPLKPTAPFSIAQGNSGTFWKLLKSKAVSYMMSCVAEIHFGQIRYMALQNLWESHKGPPGQQIRNQEWTLDELTDALAFDDDEQTLEFCQGYGLDFKTNADGIQHLDFTSQSSPLDQSSTPRKQVFSHSIVEAKRYRRSGVAVINGIGVARAIREGLVEADPEQDDVLPKVAEDSKEALFFPEDSTAPSSSSETKSTSIFNPEASTFTPSAPFQPSWSSSTTSFGKPSVLNQFASATSAPMVATNVAASASSSPSFLLTSSLASSAAVGTASAPVTNSLSTQPLASSTSSGTSLPAAAPFSLSNFKFGQSASEPSPPVSANSPFSLGNLSTTSFNSTLRHEPRAHGWQQQSSSPEKPGDASLFGPSRTDKSTPTTFSTNPNDEATKWFSQSIPEKDGSATSLRPEPQQPRQDDQKLAGDRQSIHQESLPPLAEPKPELKSVNGARLPKPPPSQHAARLELSEDTNRPQPLFPASTTESGLHFESPSTISSNGHPLARRQSDVDSSEPPTTAVATPRPVPSPDSISRSSSISSTLANTPQSTFTGTTPTPFGEAISNYPPSTRPKSPSLPPSQHPAALVPPKHRKPTHPKIKELKAVSPHDPTPRDSSPLRERPVIFGDDANAFRQSAAFATDPPSHKTVTSTYSRDAAAETVARLAILQPVGLMQEYLQFILPGLLKPILQEHEHEKPILVAKAARRQILARKYFKRWRATTYRRTINRRARDRRQLRINALEKEKQKRMRGEAELEAILQAKKEKEQMQAEMLARFASDSNSSVPDAAPNNVGQKRKSTHIGRTEDTTSSDLPRKIAKGHYRSRTLDSGQRFSNSSRSAGNPGPVHSIMPQARSSIFAGQSILNGSTTPPASRSSPLGRKDTTRTDYFRLKALGLDPETPVIPDTKASLERKRHREEIATAATRTRATTRPSQESPLPQSSLQEATTRRSSSASQSWIAPGANTKAKTPAVTDLNNDDELLRQIRQVRKAMTEGTEWFKEQAVNIEKEIEVQELLQRSASAESSRSSPHPSATGFARANGYEYLPGREIPGRSLSRTELRIRRTGARGLATKPIGGSEDYLAVAMSRDSAARLNMEKQSREISAPQTTESSRKSKRKTGEKDSRYVPQDEDEDSEELEEDAKPKKLYRWREPATNGKTREAEAVCHPSQSDRVSDEHADVEEDENDVQVSVEQPQYRGYDKSEGGDTEDLYEDGDDEDELYDEGQEGMEEYEEQEENEDDEDDDEEKGEGEEQEEEADQVRPLTHQQEHKGQGQTVGYWLRSSATPERGLTPNGGGQIMSRVSSEMGTGTGASVDDALVLDSD